MLGGVAQVTERLYVGTGVTCPTFRIHPAIIAQAAATAASMLPGRFFLGVGSGENLNERITGLHWPPPPIRLEMLEEAIDIIRTLWDGGLKSYYGTYFTVENARIYTLPEQQPPIMVAASGPVSADLAGRLGDGLISAVADGELVRQFDASGGSGKPKFGQIHVCWAADESEAVRTAHRQWPTAAIKGSFTLEMPLPSHFEEVTNLVTEEQVAQKIVCGPDPQRHIDAIQQYIDAGFDHIFVHQVGHDQEGFFRFFEREILPHFYEVSRRATGVA